MSGCLGSPAKKEKSSPAIYKSRHCAKSAQLIADIENVMKLSFGTTSDGGIVKDDEHDTGVDEGLLGSNNEKVGYPRPITP